MSLYIHETANKLPSVQVAAGLRFEECTNAELLALMGTTEVDRKFRTRNSFRLKDKN
jgi:hypothetical protein